MIDAAYAAYADHPPTSLRVGRPRLSEQGRTRFVTPARGEVWWSETPEIGRRPAVVLSRDLAISSLRRALVAPAPPRSAGPTEVLLEPGDDPVPCRSAVNLDSVENVSLGVLVERLGRLSDERMRQTCTALGVAVDCA